MGNVCCEEPTHYGTLHPARMQDIDFEPVAKPHITSKAVLERYQEIKPRLEETDLSKYPGVQQRRPQRETNRRFTYDGTWRDDKPEGKGAVYFDNGEYFEGEFKDGKAEGNGTFIFINGDHYQGSISENKAEGEGKFDGGDIEYSGTWENSKPKNGSYRIKSTGTVLNMSSEGKGVIEWANGNRYEGQISNLYPDGQGKMSFANMNLYEGQWKHGVFSGYGTFRWPDGKYYEGKYENGQKHGRGVYHYLDGRKYEGEWKDGKQDGKGKLFEDDQLIYDGLFREGAPVDSSEPALSSSQDYLTNSNKAPQPLTFYSDEPQNKEKRVESATFA